MPADTLLAPQLQQERKRRRRWLVAACALAVTVVILGTQFKTIRSSVNGWRARRLAVKAEVSIREEKWKEAMENARAAYQMKPDEPTAIRAAARLEGLSGHAMQAVGFWRQLIAMGASLPGDRLAYAGDLLRSGAISDAGQVVDELLREQPDDAPVLRLATRWAMVVGDPGKARDFATRAQKQDPASHEGRLLMGLVQLAANDPVTRDVGVKSLLELGQERSGEGIDALRRLASQREVPPDVGTRIVELIRAHPLASEVDRLNALGLETMVRPGERGALLDAAVEHYRTAEPQVKLLVGTWLYNRVEHDRVAALIPAEEALQRKDILLVYLNAIAALKRWAEVRRILEIKDVPLEGAHRDLFLARAAMELGDPTLADLHWRRAHLAAAPSPEMMGYLGDYAEKWRRFDMAEQAYRSLSNNANTARQAYEGLFRIAEQQRDPGKLRKLIAETRGRWPKETARDAYEALLTIVEGRRDSQAFWKVLAEMRERWPRETGREAYEGLLKLAGRLNDSRILWTVLGEMRERWPADAAVANDHCYFSLLLRKDLPGSFATAKELFEKAPASLAHRTTLALAACLLNDPATASSMYRGQRIPWDETGAGQRAVHAAVLGMLARTEEAATVANAIRWEDLRKEEQELIKKWRTK